MADRSVTVALKADVGGFLASMKLAQGQVVGMGKALTDTAKKRDVIGKIGTGFGIMGAAAAAGVALVVKSAADFDKAMSGVQAATHESTENMNLLRDAAIDAGAKTKYSAEEAAGGIEALAKAGVSTNDILRGGLNGALDLAAAGGQSVQDAAESAATAMTQFGLSGKDVPHIADLLAAAAGKAQGEVSDMSMALKQTGLVADQTGLTIEETTGALAQFASKGLIGSDAGTSFKSMLQRLTPETAKAQGAVELYNLSAYDQEGNFIGLEKYAGKLHDGLKDLTTEQRNATMKTLFGSDAVRAAAVLYDEGAKGVRDWTAAVDDQGFAAETAAIKMDNLAGDLEALKGSLETALIGTGEGAQAPLRSLVKTLTDLVNAYIKLPQPAKTALLGVGAFLAVFGGGAFVLSKIVLGVAGLKDGLNTLTGSSTAADKAMRGLGSGMKMAAGAMAIFTLAEVARSMDDVNLSANQMRDGLDDLAAGEVADAFANLSRNTADFGDAMHEAARADITIGGSAKEEIAAIDTAIADLLATDPAKVAEIFAEIKQTALAKGLSLEELVDLYPRLAEELKTNETPLGANYRLFKLLGLEIPGTDAAAQDMLSTQRDMRPATEETTDAVKGQTQAQRDHAAAIEAEVKAMEEWLTANEERANAAITARTDAYGLAAAWQQMDKDIRNVTGGLDKNTKKGQENNATLMEAATQWNETDKQVQNATGNYEKSRKKFVELAVAMGVPIERAQRMADKFLEVPEIERQARLDDKEAREKAQELDRLYREVPDLSTTARFEDATARGKARMYRDYMNTINAGIDDELVAITLEARADKVLTMLGPEGRAAGGLIRGPGSGTSDSIPARLSDGEYVIKAAAVKKYGNDLFDRLNNMRMTPEIGGYAAGGPAIMPRVGATGMNSAAATITNIMSTVGTAVSAALSKKANAAIAEWGAGGTYTGPMGAWQLPLSRGTYSVGGGLGSYEGHTGVDLGAALGTPIYSAANGRVSQAMDLTDSYGKHIYVDHGGGTETRYAHMQRRAKNAGDLVKAGTPIGYVNSTGNSEGHHLHYETRQGGAVLDPISFMAQRGASFDAGGLLQPGLTLAHNGTGRPERVTPSPAAGSRGNSEVQLTGSIQITNWATGEARFRGIADAQIDSHNTHRAGLRRMHA